MIAETVTLKNGSDESQAVVMISLIALDMLMNRQFAAFSNLVMKCRGQKRNFTDENRKTLMEYGLISDDGSIKPFVRNIVLSAVTGEGFDLILGSPISKR